MSEHAENVARYASHAFEYSGGAGVDVLIDAACLLAEEEGRGVEELVQRVLESYQTFARATEVEETSSTATLQ